MIPLNFWTSIILFTLVCFSIISPGCSIEVADLFPNAESDGATRFRFGDDGQATVQLSVPFIFFNKSYQSVTISGNGLVGFGTMGNLPIHPSATCRLAGLKDYRVIMPFWSDAHEGRSGSGAMLTYMETSQPSLIQKARADVITAFPEINKGSRLDLSWMFIVTWKNIGRCCSSNITSSRIRNTFQMILTKSESHSFVLLYYASIQWSNDHAWAAGFDIGKSPPIYLLPGSCTTDFRKLDSSSNIGEGEAYKGKWVFGVESNGILLPGMANMGDHSNKEELVLLIQPNVISVLGNVPILIRGPILESEVRTNISITCLFRDPSRTRPSETTGVLLTNDRVICQVPFLYSLGMMEINMMVKYPSHSNPTLYKGHIYVVKEHEIGVLPRICIEENNGTKLSLSAIWRTSSIDLDFGKSEDPQQGNLTKPNFIEVVLLELSRTSWKEVGPVTQPIPNNGAYSAPLSATSWHELTRSTFGKPYVRMFALKVQYELESAGVTLQKLFPSLAPINMSSMSTSTGHSGHSETGTNKSRGNMYDTLCKSWYDNEACPSTNLGTLPCPRSTSHVVADWRFMFEEPYHPEVDVSFIQAVPSSTGASSQCTYNSRGDLLLGEYRAGHLYRHSPNNRKDYWKHYSEDIMPYLYCCRWSEMKEANCISYYNRKRPSDNGRNYRPPGVARATGLSHITTFDGRNFALAGAGEFWLIKYSSRGDNDNGDDFDLHHPSEFRMQVRIESFHSRSANLTLQNASIITAAVMEDMSHDKEVKVQVSYLPHLSRFSVMLDDYIVNGMGGFDLYHDGVTIRFLSRNEMEISLSSGFSFSFLSSSGDNGSLNIVATADSQVIRKTKGLLGDVDKTTGTTDTDSDDLGLKWRVQENESMFSYPGGKSYADYNNKPGFTPIMITTNESVPFDKEEEFRHDNLLTNLASTDRRKAYTKYKFVRAIKVVNQCQHPGDLENGRFILNSLGREANISVSCDPGFLPFPESVNQKFVCGRYKNVMHESTSTTVGWMWIGGSLRWVNVDSGETMPPFKCLPEAEDEDEVVGFEEISTSTATENIVSAGGMEGIGMGAESISESNSKNVNDNHFIFDVIGIGIFLAVFVIATLVYVYMKRPNKFHNPSRPHLIQDNSVGEIEL